MKTTIALNEITEGMHLASDVQNAIGQIIMTAGSQLSEKHKISLKKYHIENISVISHSSELGELSEFPDADTIRAVLQSKLDWKPRNENEDDLLEAVTLYKVLLNEAD